MQTTIDDVLAKRQDEILSSQIGLQTANAGSASAEAALARSRRLTEEHNLKLSQNAGTATNPSWVSDAWRSLTGQLSTPATTRITEGMNRAAQRTMFETGRHIIKTDDELRQAKEILQQMQNRRIPWERRRELENRIIEYEYRRNRR